MANNMLYYYNVNYIFVCVRVLFGETYCRPLVDFYIKKKYTSHCSGIPRVIVSVQEALSNFPYELVYSELAFSLLHHLFFSLFFE